MIPAAPRPDDVPPPTRAATRDPWIAEEPRLLGAARDVLARAARRPARTAGLALLATGMLVGLRLARPPLYVAELTFLMTEGELRTPGQALRPPARIREYIWDVVLSRDRLLALMEKHGISAQLRAVNPVAAVTSMRDDIDIDVVRNYFLFDGDVPGGPRSAQVVLSCSGSDREQVQAIVHDIGQLVLETQAAARRVRLSHAREIHAAQALRAEDQLQVLELRRAALLARHGEAAEAPAGVRAELAALQRDITAAAARARELERRTADLEFVRDAEQQQLGLTFRLADERTRAIREPLRGARVAAFAAVLLAVVGPVVAIVLGAFDARLYRGADVLANRFPLLGTVPALPGDDAGSDRGRRRAPGAGAPGPRS